MIPGITYYWKVEYHGKSHFTVLELEAVAIKNQLTALGYQDVLIIDLEKGVSF